MRHRTPTAKRILPKARLSSNFGRIHFAAIRKSLLHRNCLNALLVTVTGELGCEELVKALAASLLVNETASYLSEP